MIKLIVGLGNPGQQYERTRHNAGFWFVDKLAEVNKVDWQSDKKFNGQLTNIKVSGNSVALLKPLTFMNKSGVSVGAYVRYFHLNTEDVLVVHDELDFIPGIIKVKKNGGHAGHNGLRDISSQLSSNLFPRIRIGIGRPKESAVVADYVLSTPSKDDQSKIEYAIDSVVTQIELLIEKDIDFSMNVFNRAS